ncbi:MAG: pre-peptidase C-terminal domain-containing protein [Elusimicrobia bacterium]|nr:pre-peptidase C-terminal domain-containing protein [Elusimicrobiota bacterium]
MKRLPSLAVLSCLLLAACGKPREKEPNDHFTSATLLKPGRTVLGTVASPKDTDVYKLDCSRPGVVSFRLGGIKDVDFAVSWQDADRVELKRFDETGTGGDEEGLDLGVSPGFYYLAVSNKNPKANNPSQEYGLDVKLDPAPGSEAEPNDTPLAASTLTVGGVTRGHYFPSRNLLSATTDQIEEDWFRITVDREGMFSLNVDVSEVPGVDGVLEVYDTANFYKVKEVDSAGPGEPEILRNFGLRGPVQYLLRLRSKSRAASPMAPYEILTELLPYSGTTEFEPNDQRLDATPFAGESINGTVSPAGDQDWYRIPVDGPEKRLLTLSLSPLKGMDLVLLVTDDLGNTLLTADNAGKEQPETMTGLGVASGTYHAVVSAKSPKASDSRKTYTLTKTLAPFQPGLEFELNDSSAAPQAVKVGESLDGYVSPKGDVDWFEFNVYQGAEVSVEATGVLNVKHVLTLFDQEYQELHTASSTRTGDAAAFQRRLEPGTYFLRLAPADPGQNNARDKYTLRLKAQ